MILIGLAAARRRMRQHQNLPTQQPRLSLWRLLLGEAAWALGQLVREPRVLSTLLVGGSATFAVLTAAAPGPVLPWPGRLVVGLLVGLAMARGVWAWIRRRMITERDDPRETEPAVAATEVVAGLTGLVLIVWLVVWLVTLAA